MIKGKVYKGGRGRIYEQHYTCCTSLEYSLDEGKTWEDVPVDLGKINYFEAWYRLKD